MRPSRSCAAPMSITASGAPPATTLPATLTCRRCRPTCSMSCGAVAGVSFIPSACRAAALRNTVAGANNTKRSSARLANGRGIRSGAMRASSRASAPIRRSGVGVVLVAAGVAGSGSARTDASSTGLARATWGWLAMRANSDSSKRPWVPRNCKSGWPLTLRSACANSPSAEALIVCTANASATPSTTAHTAAALRHGWWRSSCRDQRRSRESMGAIVALAQRSCIAFQLRQATLARRNALKPCQALARPHFSE